LFLGLERRIYSTLEFPQEIEPKEHPQESGLGRKERSQTEVVSRQFVFEFVNAAFHGRSTVVIAPDFNSLHQNLLVDPAAKYLDGTPPRLGNSVLTLIKDILINIVNRSITLSKETDFVFDFLSENIKTTGSADRSAGANCIS
jgi:hypothetical protein